LGEKIVLNGNNEFPEPQCPAVTETKLKEIKTKNGVF
jgi:hypothetical protein